MAGYGGSPWGSNNRGGLDKRSKIYIFVTVIVIILIGLYYLLPAIKEQNAKQSSYNIEDNNGIRTTSDYQGNPFGKDSLGASNRVTVGYYRASVKTNPALGKFSFSLQLLDTNEKPRKKNFILDIAISNDGGLNKTILCTDKYVEESELDDDASVTLSFSLDKIEVKSGTIVYYRIRCNQSDESPAVGELTL